MAHLLIHRGLAKKNFTENTISAFKYCFKKNYDYDPILKLYKLRKNFEIKMSKNSLKILSIPVKHGLINSIAYIINKKIAYVSDANEIYLKRQI